MVATFEKRRGLAFYTGTSCLKPPRSFLFTDRQEARTSKNLRTFSKNLGKPSEIAEKVFKELLTIFEDFRLFLENLGKPSEFV